MSDQLERFYRDREIFITGGSGFIGKGVIEKILHSFNVKKIYLLIREKKGVPPEKRLELLKNDKIFDVLKEDKPNELDKLTAIPGDVSHLNLGLSPASLELLQNVSLVFHSAATIRFDEPLKKVVLINVRGTREVLRTAEKMPKLEMFLHISTLFSNCNRSHIDEKLYPAPVDWRSCIKIAEQADESQLCVLTEKFAYGLPNTYTFAKALSEHVVNDFQDSFPVAIIRPSIVLCTLFDPFQGYTDNMAGSMSVIVGGGAGILRNLLCDPDITPNQVSLDLVSRLAILSTWKAANCERQKMPFICNISGEIFPEFSIRKQVGILEKKWKDMPSGRMFWKPHIHLTNSPTIFYIRLMLFQLIPAVLADVGVRLAGHAPVFVKFQRTIVSAVKGFQFFLSSTFVSGCENLNLLMDEAGKFPGFEIRQSFQREPSHYAETVALSCRRFILKENDSDLPRARRIYKWLVFGDIVLKGIWMLTLAYVLYRGLF